MKLMELFEHSSIQQSAAEHTHWDVALEKVPDIFSSRVFGPAGVPVLPVEEFFLSCAKQLMEASLKASVLIFGDLRQFDVKSFGVPLGAGDPKPTKASARPARGQDREQEAENKGQKGSRCAAQ